MAIVPYPPTVPKPLISVSRTQAQTFQLVQPLRGPGYVKRLNNDAPVTYELNWRLSRDQSAQLQTWFYSMSASGLAMGRNQFQLELDTEWGKLLHTLQITPETFAQNQEAHNVFSYQAVAIARKVPIPQWWFDNESLVNSEFFYQRGLFDLVMNRQLPSAYGDNVIAFIDARNESIKGIEFSRSSPATYVDFSGNLRTSDIGEPRFDGYGLMKEVSSINMCRWNNTRIAGGATVTAVTSGKYIGITAKKMQGGTSSFPLGASREIIIPSTTYSGTMILDLSNSNLPSEWVRLQFAYSANWQSRYVNVNINTLEVRQSANTTGTAKRYGDLLIVTATTESLATVDPAGGSLDCYYLDNSQATVVPGANNFVCIVGFQLEEMPFATSYIPTTDSRVARAEDTITIDTNFAVAKRLYREYTPIGSSTSVVETVPYLGELCPAGNIRLLKVLND